MDACAEHPAGCFICGGRLGPAPSKLFLRCESCAHEVRAAPGGMRPMVNEVLDASRIRKRDQKDRFQIRIARRACRTGKCLIDIGAGSGRFLYHVRRYFQRVLGIEVSPACIEFARGALSLEIHESLQAEPLREADVVCAWHSLEHLPTATLGATLDLLRDNLPREGALVISVPNMDGPHGRCFAMRSVYFDAENHQHQFSARSLELLLKQYGFAIRSWHTSFAYSFLGNLLTLLNLTRAKHNELYYALRRGVRHDRSTLQIVAWHAVLAPFFVLPALFLFAYESVCPREGAVITVIARR